MNYSPGGNCYKKAHHILASAAKTSDMLAGWALCHGTMRGVEGADICGHAWVEFEGLVLDPTFGTIAQKNYYAIGDVREVTRFSWDEAKEKLRTTGHYGPWDKRGTP